MHYHVDFECRDEEPLQALLNDLYDYRDDVGTKVLHRCRLNLFTLLLGDLIRRGVVTRFGRALDIGCNAGMYSAILSDLGFRSVLGVDVVPEMIAKAQHRFASSDPERAVEFRLQAAESLGSASPFDFVLCTEVIEHTREPARVIENLRALIAPGGVAIVSMPNRISFPYLTAWLTYRLRRQPRDEDFERHLEYPFYRAMRLFTDHERRLVHVDGTNLLWTDRSIRRAYGSPRFARLNRWNFRMARAWPLRYFAQFFYIVVRRRAATS